MRVNHTLLIRLQSGPSCRIRLPPRVQHCPCAVIGLPSSGRFLSDQFISEGSCIGLSRNKDSPGHSLRFCSANLQSGSAPGQIERNLHSGNLAWHVNQGAQIAQRAISIYSRPQSRYYQYTWSLGVAGRPVIRRGPLCRCHIGFPECSSLGWASSFGWALKLNSPLHAT